MDYFHQFRATYEYNDPLEGLRLPILDKYISDLADGDEQTRLHYTEIIAAALLYQAMYIFFGLILPLFPNIVKKLGSKKAQIDFSIRCVSIIQSPLICILAIPMICNQYLQQDRIFSVTPYGSFFCRMATGYFIWDIYISIIHIKLFGPAFLAHALISTAVCAIGASGYIQYYAPLFLIFEASTPFLNIRWFGLKFPEYIGPTFQLINNIILILIFFFIRICWGWIQIIRLTRDFIAVSDDPRFNLTYSVIICSGNLVLDILNIYWFGKMMTVAINTLKKMFGSNKEVDDSKLKLM